MLLFAARVSARGSLVGQVCKNEVIFISKTGTPYQLHINQSLLKPLLAQ